MTPERLAELQHRYDGLNPDAYAPNHPVAHVAELLVEVQRLTDELDALQASSDQAWTREIDLRAGRDEARRITRTFTRHVGIVAARALCRSKLDIDPLPEWFYGIHAEESAR
jgi:hypothetical protein